MADPWGFKHEMQTNQLVNETWIAIGSWAYSKAY